MFPAHFEACLENWWVLLLLHCIMYQMILSKSQRHESNGLTDTELFLCCLMKSSSLLKMIPGSVAISPIPHQFQLCFQILVLIAKHVQLHKLRLREKKSFMNSLQKKKNLELEASFMFFYSSSKGASNILFSHLLMKLYWNYPPISPVRPLPVCSRHFFLPSSRI